MRAGFKVDRVEDSDGTHVFTQVNIVADAIFFPGAGLHACFYLDVEPDHCVFVPGAWPETLNLGAIGRRGCELIDHPVFAPGTVAGEAIVVGARNADVLVSQHGYDDSWRDTQVLVFDRNIVPIPEQA